MRQAIAGISIVCLAASSASAGPSADQLLAQSIYDQILPCWDGVADLEESSRLLVSIRIVVLDDGFFAGPPTVQRPAQLEEGDADMAIAVERALAAVEGCKPYEIPPDRAPLPVTINFGPLKPGPMLG